MKCNHNFPSHHLEQWLCIAWLLDRGPSALIASWFICISTARWIRSCLHAVPSVSNEDAFSQTPMRTARMKKALSTPGNILSVTHHIVMQCAHSMWWFNGVVILPWFFVQNSIYEKQAGDGICFRAWASDIKKYQSAVSVHHCGALRSSSAGRVIPLIYKSYSK